MSDLLNRNSHRPAPLVNPQRWPDIANVPAASIKATIARVLFRRVARKLPLRVEFPGGEVLGRGGPVMRILRPAAFYRRIGAGGLIGFGEAYMAGDWAAHDLPGVLTIFASQVSKLVPPALQRLRVPPRYAGSRAPSARHPGKRADQHLTALRSVQRLVLDFP